MKVNPAKFIEGKLSLPGDKSISHRAAMIAAMATGATQIENFATGADCASTLECLRGLGVEIVKNESSVIVKGVGRNGFSKPNAPLDCGNSGTTMRLLSGILAGQAFDSVLTGDESLQKRPMKRVIEPLSQMGVKIESVASRGQLKIIGNDKLSGIEYHLQVASAQIKSCVLLAGLNASGKTSLIEHVSTRDHTERMLRWFSVDIKEEKTPEGKRLTIHGGSELTASDISVPGDISSASFFIVAAASLNGSELIIENVGLNPTRTAVIDTIRRFGADITIKNERIICNEPVGDLTIRGGLNPADARLPNKLFGDVIANLIDEIPILAVLGTRLNGGIEIRDASELRLKESDRIASVVKNLKAMGANVEEFPDGFKVERSRLRGAAFDAFGDHRIAMAFAIAGLIAEGETEILNADCANVSFPGFFDVLASVVS